MSRTEQWFAISNSFPVRIKRDHCASNWDGLALQGYPHLEVGASIASDHGYRM